jgi:hypothetical protein
MTDRTAQILIAAMAIQAEIEAAKLDNTVRVHEITTDGSHLTWSDLNYPPAWFGGKSDQLMNLSNMLHG